MMKNYAIYKNQKQAISAAKKLAKEAAADNSTDWTESVLLASGDTLHLTSSPSGRITQRIEAGWITDGPIHCSKRAADVAL